MMIPTAINECVNGTIKMQRDFTGPVAIWTKVSFHTELRFQLAGLETCETKTTLQSVMQLILSYTT